MHGVEREESCEKLKLMKAVMLKAFLLCLLHEVREVLSCYEEVHYLRNTEKFMFYNA